MGGSASCPSILLRSNWGDRGCRLLSTCLSGCFSDVIAEATVDFAPNEERRRLPGCRDRGRAVLLSRQPPTRPRNWAEIGGRSKSKPAVENTEPLSTVDNAVAVRDLVAQLIGDVHAGKVHPKVAAGLAPLMNLQLRAIETSNLELQSAKPEKRLTRLKAGGDRKSDVQPGNAWAARSQSMDG